jgi:hypothetical protein
MASRIWIAKLSFNKPELGGAAPFVVGPLCEFAGILL